MIGDLRAETVRIEGAGGDEIEAYVAQPLDGGPRGGVVVIHHMPGYDAATKEITRRFAAHGYAAICPNLYYREAPGADPDDAAAAARAAGGVPDERLRRRRRPARPRTCARCPASNGKVGTIGYCSGGRQSFLAARQPSTSTPPSTATAPSSSAPRRRASRCRSPRSTTGSASCAARCSACSATRTSTRRPSTSTSSRRLLKEAGKTLRVPPLRRRRPRASSPSTGPATGRRPPRRLAADLRLLRPAPGGLSACAPTTDERRRSAAAARARAAGSR